MRYLPSDKYNVAWFKLAECVSRGEKERALGVYRLLAHSFEDRAYAMQLEGDILLAFDDKSSAIEKFKEAVELYRKDHRVLEAAAVSEHLILLLVDKKEYTALLVELYSVLSIESKMIFYMHMLITLCIERDELEQAVAAMHQLDEHRTARDTIAVRRPLVMALCQQRSVPRSVVHVQIERLLDGLIGADDGKLVHRFLAELAGMQSEYHAHAQAYVVMQPIAVE